VPGRTNRHGNSFICFDITPRRSTLALLVTGVGADHPDHAIAADDLAIAADAFD
jgi:hypothetical protein